MNNKIFAELINHSQKDISKITLPYIQETFGVKVPMPRNGTSLCQLAGPGLKKCTRCRQEGPGPGR